MNSNSRMMIDWILKVVVVVFLVFKFLRSLATQILFLLLLIFFFDAQNSKYQLIDTFNITSTMRSTKFCTVLHFFFALFSLYCCIAPLFTTRIIRVEYLISVYKFVYMYTDDVYIVDMKCLQCIQITQVKR